MLNLYFMLKLQKIRERRIHTLLSAGLNLSHMHVTHIRVTYLLLFNLRFYSSRYLSNIHIAQNRRSFTRLSVVQYNKRILFEFYLNFWIFIDIFFIVVTFSFLSLVLDSRINHYSLWKRLQIYSDQTCQLTKLSIKIVSWYKWFYRYEGYSVESSIL